MCVGKLVIFTWPSWEWPLLYVPSRVRWPSIQLLLPTSSLCAATNDTC